MLASQEKPDSVALQRAVDHITRGRRPVIYAGAGVLRSGAWARLTALAERLTAPSRRPIR
jgi:thiamine pyrophosphate-dependent acetolactate synthase large subunit-like protein